VQYVKSFEGHALVEYEIVAIKAEYENSLYQHLFDKVWGFWGEVEEDIRVLTDNLKSPSKIISIRYQFGLNFDEDKLEEVGEKINEEIGVWIEKNSAKDCVFA